MILNYAEASAYATQFAIYLLLASMGTMIFIWAWQNIVTYFHWYFEPQSTLDDVVDALEEIHASIETANDEPRQLEIVA